jgi:hypothetical protein
MGKQLFRCGGGICLRGVVKLTGVKDGHCFEVEAWAST